MSSESKAQPESAEEYFWSVVDKTREEIEVWTSQERAEASMESGSAPAENLFLYHVAASEIARAFPNRPVSGGDSDVATKNKYIRKGWDPGTK